MLAISSFTKKYHDQMILSVKSLQLSAGVHIIKGDNGSGKSTFFKCLAGIIPCSGEIRLGHRSQKDNPVEYRYRVNYSEAEPRYPAFLTASDLMQFVGETKSADAAQIIYYCRELGIDWFYKKSCGTYSSGMLKKLSLAIAFLGRPEMIILDEPLITLDESTRKSLFKLIREKRETIFLLSSHQAIDSDILDVTTTFHIENKTLVLESGNGAAQ